MTAKDRKFFDVDDKFLRLKKTDIQHLNGSWHIIKDFIDEKFEGQKANTFVMLYHLAALGIYQSGGFILPFEETITKANLRYLRIFDEEKECFVWKSEDDDVGIFRLRYRLDEEDLGQEPNALDAKQLLWGTKIASHPEAGADWKLLKEDRGVQINIHKDLLPNNYKVDTKNRLWLITRNYVDYNDVCQAGYVDSRFVGITDKGGQEK